MEHQVFLSCKHIICFMKLYITGEQSCYISGISNYILQLSITNITSSSSRFLTILPCQVDMGKAQASLYFRLQYQQPDGCFLPAGCRSRSQPERNLQTRPQKKIQLSTTDIPDLPHLLHGYIPAGNIRLQCHAARQVHT